MRSFSRVSGFPEEGQNRRLCGEKAQDALLTLAGQWKERFEYIQAATPGHEKIPPVMIIVCDNTDIAEVFYREISGEESVEVVEDTEDAAEEDEGIPRKKKKAKRKTTYGTGKVFPECFSNRDGLHPTLRIDSKLLAEAESEDQNATRKEAAESLREIVSTVGRPGKPGRTGATALSLFRCSQKDGMPRTSPISWGFVPLRASCSVSRWWAGDSAGWTIP